MISRNRSGCSTAASFIEPTTSTNSTVTCLYSVTVGAATGAPHASQKRALTRRSLPHDPHRPVASSTGLLIPRFSPRREYPNDRLLGSVFSFHPANSQEGWPLRL